MTHPLDSTIEPTGERELACCVESARLLELALESADEAVSPATTELPADTEDLHFLRLIASGGMGLVYEARHRSLERRVAVKFITASLAQRPGFAERFEREALSLANLDHPGVVTVLDFGVAQGRPYLVMEYIDGVSLRGLASSKAGGSAWAPLFRQVCEALSYAHREGIVHRDLKPENILVSRAGEAKLVDFGLAQLRDEGLGLTASRQAMGTPIYMAPEQLHDPAGADERADIYALGVTMYEMLTGRLPLGRFAPPSATHGVDPRWDPVVMRCLEYDQHDRYPGADELRDALVALEGPSRSGERRRLQWRRGAMASVGVSLAMSGWLLWQAAADDSSGEASAEAASAPAAVESPEPPAPDDDLPVGCGMDADGVRAQDWDLARNWVDRVRELGVGHVAALARIRDIGSRCAFGLDRLRRDVDKHGGIASIARTLALQSYFGPRIQYQFTFEDGERIQYWFTYVLDEEDRLRIRDIYLRKRVPPGPADWLSASERAVENIGACREFLSKYRTCIREHAPRANQAQRLLEMRRTVQQWRHQALLEPESLAETCSEELEAARKATKNMGCQW